MRAIDTLIALGNRTTDVSNFACDFRDLAKIQSLMDDVIHT